MPPDPPPPDPRFTQPSAPTVPGESIGAPRPLTPEAQENQVRLLLNDIFRASLPNTDPLHINILPVDLDRYEQLLGAWAFHAPDLVTRVSGELQTQYGFDPIADDTLLDPALAAALNQILSTAEQRSETIRTDVEGVTTVTREGATETERETTVSQTRFIEMPTPEEFMDDFTNGLSAFVIQLRREGRITRDAADWALDNPDFFLDRYITAIQDMIDAGKDIFRPVGATGDPIFLGEREAGTEEIESTGIDRERILSEVLANEREQIEEEVIRDLIATGTVETTEQQQQVDAEIDRRVERRTQTLINEAIQFFGTETTITTEQVFSIPRPTNVFVLAPGDFLSSEFPAQNVEQIAAGRRGADQGRRSTELGVAPSAPRRVGGR